MKVVGVVKSIVGTDAVIAIDEDGNQRAIFPGDTLYDNEKLLELSGVQVNVEPVTVADSHKKSETKSDKEVASLQDALLNGKDISELEETAAGSNAGGGNASSDGVSLGAASFVTSGHESSIHADASAISEVAPASVAGVTNVSGGAEEFTSSLETLTVANELVNRTTPVSEPVVQPVATIVGETPVAPAPSDALVTPAPSDPLVTPSTDEVPAAPSDPLVTPVAPAPSDALVTPVEPERPVSGETPVAPAPQDSLVTPAEPTTPETPVTPPEWTEPIVVDPSDPRYDHNHHFDDEPTTPVQPTPSTPALPSNPVNEDDDSDEDNNDQPIPPAPSGNEEWFALDGIIDNAVDRVVDSGISVGSGDETIKYDGGLYKFQGDIEENAHDEAHIIYTNDNTPSLRGSATPGATINVYNEAGAIVATHVVDDSSIYDIELPLLADGAYKFKMEAISPTTGEVFATKETTPFTVDTNAPTIEWTKTPSTITADGVVYKNGDAQLEFAGKTEPYSDVRIIMVDKSNNNSVDMQVRADEHGEFSQKVSEMFPKGTYDVSVQVTDPAGNWIAPIKLPVTVDKTPAEPTGKAENPIIGTEEFHLTSFVDDRSFKKGWTANYSWGPNDYEGDLLNFTHPTHGNRLTNDNTPVLSGKATPGAKITIYDNKEAEVGSGVADKDGNWSIATSKLKDGNHILEVEAHSGTTGELIGKFGTPEIVVDATLIDYSVDRRPYDYSDYAFEYSTHIAADKNPTFGGKTEPNTLVKMTATGNNYVIETFKTSDSEGNYDISIPGLKAGTYVIDVEAIDDAGNITFVPDYDWSNAHTWDFTNLDKSPYDFTMSIMDNVGEKQGDLMLDDKPITDDNILTFSGTGTPGAKVVLYEDHLTVENTVNNWTDSKPFAEVTVGADGRWSYTPDSAFLNTRYGFAGKQIDTVDGQTVTYKLTKGVLVDADIPTAEDMTVHSKLALTDMVIDSDDPGLLYHLTKSPLIDLEERITDFTPTFIGTSEPFANIKIEAKGTYSGDLYSNLDKLVTLYTKADEKGNWKVESDKELGLFDHEVKVSTINDSGAVLSSLDPIDFMMPTRALHTDPFAAL